MQHSQHHLGFGNSVYHILEELYCKSAYHHRSGRKQTHIPYDACPLTWSVLCYLGYLHVTSLSVLTILNIGSYEPSF